jgi:hypothetical protein
MWEARFRTTIFFYEVTPVEQVSLLGDALEGPALRFYYKEIVPDTARAGGGVHPGSAADPATNLSPNVTSLSQAIRMLETEFCSPDARNVLRQELMSLSLSDIQLEMDLTKVDALYELTGRILRLTANGPAEYKGPKFMFDSLRDAPKGEMWAVGPIVDCEVKCLSINDAVGFLVNILRTTRSMGGEVY